MSRTCFTSLGLLLCACSADPSGSGGGGGSGGEDVTAATTKASATATTGTTTAATATATTVTNGSGSSVSTTGMGGAGPSSSGVGGGGGGAPCAHDVCTEGVALVDGCDPCVTTVCAADPFCCDALDGAWDDVCVGEAVTLCGAPCQTPLMPGDLVITEIMNNPMEVSDAAGEWFEIFNTTGSDIDLQGFVIHHDDMDPPHLVATSLVVPALGYAVLGNNSDPLTNGGVTVDYVATDIFLNNTVDLLGLEAPGGLIIDDLIWDQASGLDPDGASRSLDPNFIDALANDDDTNFCEATTFISGGAGDRGTPGAANDPCP